MNIVEFDPMRRFARPCAVLSTPGKLRTGEQWFTIDYLPLEHEGGGQIGIWDGTDYGLALAELASLQRQGTTVHDAVPRAVAHG